MATNVPSPEICWRRCWETWKWLPIRSAIIGLLPDTYNFGLCMRRECGERFPRRRLHGKPLVSDPGRHHDTCVTHVPWCMPGSLTRGGGKKPFPAFPAHAQTALLRIWQEAHWDLVKMAITERRDNEFASIISSKTLTKSHEPRYGFSLIFGLAA